jgi:hypothetical protein
MECWVSGWTAPKQELTEAGSDWGESDREPSCNGGRTFLTLSANADILRMVIGRLRMRIERGTATIMCKIKNLRSESVNETTDDLTDVGKHDYNKKCSTGCRGGDHCRAEWIG